MVLAISQCSYTFVIEQEEQYESRGSRMVLWERRGETPLRDPTTSNSKERYDETTNIYIFDFYHFGKLLK